jgi:hypothetical protein
MAGQDTRPSHEARATERREAHARGDAGGEPMPEELDAADRNVPDDDVADHYQEMAERGAHQMREGRVP